MLKWKRIFAAKIETVMGAYVLLTIPFSVKRSH